MKNSFKAAFAAICICAVLTACKTQNPESSTADNAVTAVSSTMTTTSETSNMTTDSAAETKCTTAVQSTTVMTTASTAAKHDSAVNTTFTADTTEAKTIHSTNKTTSSNVARTTAKRQSSMDNEFKTDYMTIKLHPNNIISISENDLEAEPTGEELAAALNAAFTQYFAALAKDLNSYLETFRFSDLAEPTAEVMRDVYQHQENELRDYLKKSGLGTKYELIDDMWSLIYDLVDETYQDKLEAMEDTYRPKQHDESTAFLKAVFSSINGSSQSVIDNIEDETLYDSKYGVEPLAGISKDTVYTMFVKHCSRETTANGSNVFMNCIIVIDTAEKEYIMNDVYCWMIDGQCGVCIDDSLHTGNVHAGIKGKSAEELFEMLKKNKA